jgi:hypothetical protein
MNSRRLQTAFLPVSSVQSLSFCSSSYEQRGELLFFYETVASYLIELDVRLHNTKSPPHDQDQKVPASLQHRLKARGPCV